MYSAFTGLLCRLCLMMVAVTAGPASTAVSKHYFNAVAGPFRFLLDRIENCPPETEARLPVSFQYKATRHRTHFNLWNFWVNFTTPCTFDDAYDLELNWASWSARGGWKENAYIMKALSFCKFVPVHTPDLWTSLMYSIFGDTSRRCPFPPGNYLIRNISSELKIKFLPIFYYGSYRIHSRVYDNDRETAMCCRIFAKIVPRTP